MKQIGSRCKQQIYLFFLRFAVAMMVVVWVSVSVALTNGTATQIARSACGKWTLVKSADGPSSNSQLNGVSASAANNVWAVGGYQSANDGPFRTLTERWDGSAWSFVRSANDGAEDTLYGVAAISPMDVWAVGYFMATLSSPESALIEHWNGQKWSVVPSPLPGQLSWLFGVKAVSTNDVWAAGFYYNNAGNSQTLIEHWDGEKWKIVPSPNPGSTDNQLHAFAVVSAKDIWVVGAQSSDAGNSYQTLVERWNGTQWNVVPSPSPGSPLNDLQGITAISADDAWTVGQYTGRTFVNQTLGEHWDGKSWKVVPTPDINPAGNDLSDVTALAGTDVWAVGSYFKSGIAQTLVEHWDGKRWRIVPSPNPGTQWDELHKMTKIGHTLWSVGYFENANIARTLVESLCH
jgi:hypothetical protein